MHIYSIINVDKLKLFAPYTMINVEAKVRHVLPSIEELAPRIMDELKEDFVLQNKVLSIRRG